MITAWAAECSAAHVPESAVEHADLCSALSADALCHFVTKQPTLLIEKADRLQSILTLYGYTAFLSPTHFLQVIYTALKHCMTGLSA